MYSSFLKQLKTHCARSDKASRRLLLEGFLVVRLSGQAAEKSAAELEWEAELEELLGHTETSGHSDTRKAGVHWLHTDQLSKSLRRLAPVLGAGSC